jgi:hypothetical protein
MKATFALAAVLLLSSTGAYSQNFSERSYSETSIQASQDNMSFAKAQRRKVSRSGCGCASEFQYCCARMDPWNGCEVLSYYCKWKNTGPCTVCVPR